MRCSSFQPEPPRRVELLLPLTALDEVGVVDAFGVRFSMQERGRVVRCHVFRSAIEAVEERPAMTDAELLVRFQRSRGLFERLASNLFDAGHRNPWIEAFNIPE